MHVIFGHTRMRRPTTAKRCFALFCSCVAVLVAAALLCVSWFCFALLRFASRCFAWMCSWPLLCFALLCFASLRFALLCFFLKRREWFAKTWPRCVYYGRPCLAVAARLRPRNLSLENVKHGHKLRTKSHKKSNRTRPCIFTYCPICTATPNKN